MDTKIVIIDDNEYKRVDSKEALERLYEKVTFYEFSSRNEALYFLWKNSNEIDLVILDWNFPLEDNGMPEIGMGDDVLREMKRQKMKINTIICSSDEVIMEEEYPNVIGCIVYNPMVSMIAKYEELLGKTRRQEEKIEEEVEPLYPVIERDSPASFKNKQKFCWYPSSYTQLLEQEKQEQKAKTRYKRPRSSDPWWKKN